MVTASAPQPAGLLPLSRAALLAVLTTIQNGATFARQDIVSFAGLCSAAEISEHVWACFGRLTPAEKARALAALRLRLEIPEF